MLLAILDGQTPAAQTEASNVSTFMEFSQKMLENLFNYASSFAVSASDMRQRNGGMVLVLKPKFDQKLYFMF